MTAEDLKTILEIAQAISRLIPQIATAIRYIQIKTMQGKPHTRQQPQRDKRQPQQALQDNGNDRTPTS